MRGSNMCVCVSVCFRVCVSRYVGKEVVRRGIAMDSACDELVSLIKEHGRWVDPPKEEEEEQAKQLVAA